MHIKLKEKWTKNSHRSVLNNVIVISMCLGITFAWKGECAGPPWSSAALGSTTTKELPRSRFSFFVVAIDHYFLLLLLWHFALPSWFIVISGRGAGGSILILSIVIGGTLPQQQMFFFFGGRDNSRWAPHFSVEEVFMDKSFIPVSFGTRWCSSRMSSSSGIRLSPRRLLRRLRRKRRRPAADLWPRLAP